MKNSYLVIVSCFVSIFLLYALLFIYTFFNFKLIKGFEEYVEYDFRFKNEVIHKKVIFFLAKTNIKKISLSHEHNDYLWLGYNDALKKTTFENAKNVLVKANKFLLDASS